MKFQLTSPTAALVSLIAFAGLSATAGAASTILAYQPGTAKPGDRVKIVGQEFPDQGQAQVVYGTGAAFIAAIPAVSKWTPDVIRVDLPKTMPAGTYWLGVANRNGKLKFKGPRSLVVTGSSTPPKPPGPQLDTSGQGTVLGQSPKLVDGALLRTLQLAPDLAITGFAGYPSATIGDTVSLRAVIQNHTGGPSALPHYLFHYGKDGKVERSKAFQLPAKGKSLQVAMDVYIDPKKVSAQKSILYFKNLFWVGTSQDTAPNSFKDANNTNNQRLMTMLATKP